MRSICILLSTVLMTSCVGKLGPTSLRNDCLTYNRAVQSSNDMQLLLNLVRLRYRDTPTFLQIGVISSSYELKRSLAAEIKENNLDQDVLKLGLDLTDKPTTTYSPIRGKGFSEELLTPIQLQSVLLLNSSGWRMDRIFRIVVQRMNGLANAPSASGPTPDHAPEYKAFYELMGLFRELELQDAINVVVDLHPNTGKPVVAITLEPKVGLSQQYARIWELLELDADTYKIRLLPYHGRERRGDEVYVDTRSLLSLLYFLSQGVNVPERDEQAGRVTVTFDENGDYFDWSNLLDGIMSINSVPIDKKDCPVPCGTCVCYRGAYFYIDDRDLSSKATFSLLSQLMALQGSCPMLPALTISLD